MPRYVIDEAALTRNLEILASVRERAGVKILLAQKAFSCFELYPLVARYLDGATASGLFEARLAHEEMPGKENHVFAPAFRAEDMPELLRVVNHIVFNSPRQVEKFGEMARAAGVSVGLRVNPEVPVATTPAYDPCRPGSRLGVTRAVLDAVWGESQFAATDGSDAINCVPPATDAQKRVPPVDGLHFHCLCEQGVEELRKVLAGFEAKFGDLLPQMKWVNFGGGHHITRADYDVDGLVELLLDFKRRHPHLTVYLEPGEAVALDAGTLEATVLEIQPPGADGISNAILDVSAACHMPDVLEMPYTPRVSGASPLSGPAALSGAAPLSVASRLSSEGTLRPEGPFKYLYRFGGPTCLAGDTIGEYSFPHALAEGDMVVFEDMAIYSMVKNNTFNGMPLPDIALKRKTGEVEMLRRFGYADFKERL
ncbi:MAG: carboxynorspermidine decarboxylase [Kiritimatiellae bacterium]|nr:carboxynorspermidine decarboxylase [Kiritimatiellia bacterium]